MLTLTNKIIDYENGELDDEATIALFQDLINTGVAWELQGNYGRTAKDLIEAGLCTRPKTKEVQLLTLEGFARWCKDTSNDSLKGGK